MLDSSGLVVENTQFFASVSRLDKSCLAASVCFELPVNVTTPRVNVCLSLTFRVGIKRTFDAIFYYLRV
jgi:hypothetical protein